MAGDDNEREKRSRIHSEIWEETITPAFQRSDKIFEAWQREQPLEYLLHFTSASALVSIVQGRTLRLSRARASNDPKELDHGIAIARHEQDKAAEDEGDRIFSKELAASFDGRLEGKDHPTFDPVICCFTETDSADVVAHWAMYGRDGSGFGLKFKGKALNETAGITLAKVNYKEEEQRFHMRELLALGRETSRRAATYAAEHHGEGWAERSFRIAAHVFGGIISLHSASMKAPEFAAEKEWRLLHPGIGDDVEAKIGTDARGPILRTYLDMKFQPDDLVSIIVGPVHADLNRPVVSALLRRHGYANTTIETGKVALRTLRDDR